MLIATLEPRADQDRSSLHEPPSRMGEEFHEHLAALAEQGRTALMHAVESAKASGVQATVELVDEKPAQALLAAADKFDARLIVVGTYGESPLRGAMLGSTPHKLLHWSTRPVLCVPPPAERTRADLPPPTPVILPAVIAGG